MTITSAQALDQARATPAEFLVMGGAEFDACWLNDSVPVSDSETPVYLWARFANPSGSGKTIILNTRTYITNQEELYYRLMRATDIDATLNPTVSSAIPIRNRRNSANASGSGIASILEYGEISETGEIEGAETDSDNQFFQIPILGVANQGTAHPSLGDLQTAGDFRPIDPGEIVYIQVENLSAAASKWYLYLKWFEVPVGAMIDLGVVK